MKNLKKTVLAGLSEITGLEEDQLMEISNKNLFELGIMDSLSFSNLINYIEDEQGITINLQDYDVKKFVTIDDIIMNLE